MKKATIIILYGPIAVGKFTIAKILAKRLGYKLAHNHALNDFVEEIFKHGSKEGDGMKEKMRLFFYELVAKSGINAIITHCFSYNFVSSSGLISCTKIQHSQA